ncbi:Alpha/Beta hydrolase protein [Protomyces lactucae-debilis]|uniref:Carboxypeptidase n=1 Tax=Protomyces lactucae-debilis TaxID=2754530 RepID=A0A1Y2FIQ3_PROLT|nr:Alpha/Beta hydrolase protein [Protomyces lactucae-debilis]ORY83852.1 Alpha/Beta hydrolase protein [Protomyces lactucae-debilis]
MTSHETMLHQHVPSSRNLSLDSAGHVKSLAGVDLQKWNSGEICSISQWTPARECSLSTHQPVAVEMYWTPLLFSHLAAAIFSDGRSQGLAQINGTADSCISSPQQAGCKTEWLIKDPIYPSAVLRIKKADTKLGHVCEGAGSGYTGYLSFDHDKRTIYFIFFESQSKPLEDPVAIWMQGGPGASSLPFGLLAEHGPCLIDGTSTKTNPYSWNKFANMIYVDQPAGTGFSFSTTADPRDTTSQVADDMVMLLHLFYQAFPGLKKNPLHLTGESYAGKWIPPLAKKVLDANKKYKKANHIPLSSIVIGGGYLNAAVQDPTIYDYACLKPHPIVKTLVNATACASMSVAATHCKALWAKYTRLGGKKGRAARQAAEEALHACYRELYPAIRESGTDMYLVSRHCSDKSGDCDPKSSLAEQYLQRSEVAAAFGADSGVFHAFNDKIQTPTEYSGDEGLDTGPTVAGLLDAGIPVLIYSGLLDARVPFVGSMAVLDQLVWSGSDQFKAAQNAPFGWSGGVKWGAKNLLYVLFEKAGHLVPRDDPVNAFQLLKGWLDGTLMR